jgi:aspartate/methionine/tyrosine aminotransferase
MSSNNFSKLFKTQNKAGIAKIMEKAFEMGFSANSLDWANLGQGSPELGVIKGDLERIKNIKTSEFAGYPPVAGLKDLRQKIADFYNQIYRLDQSQKYTWQNVCVLNGGRGAIFKTLAILNKIKFGYLLPDYSAYEGAFEMLENLDLEPILMDEGSGFEINLKKITNTIKQKSLKGLLMSNPCNPTGQILAKKDLKQFLGFLRNEIKSSEFCLIHDEFYSRFIYNSKTQTISATEFVNDIEKENIFIIDGLTKSWRYPGWRLSWVLGPKMAVEEISNLASFMDGGSAFPIQNAALELLNPQTFMETTASIQKVFNQKREFLIDSLDKLGLKIICKPLGAFYIFVDISNLKKGFNTDFEFVQKALDKKLIVIPGSSFDINPFKKRSKTNFTNYIRLSYGPEMEIIKRGVEKLKELLI